MCFGLLPCMTGLWYTSLSQAHACPRFVPQDEPENDLDVETLRALENAVANFAGTALIISHDRWFLDRIATHILAFEDDGSQARLHAAWSWFLYYGMRHACCCASSGFVLAF